MRAWRIFNHVHDEARNEPPDPVDGDEAMHASGRWHHRGTRVVYASSSAGLALLEVLVHLDGDDGDGRTLATIELPDDALETVPKDVYDELVRRSPDDPTRGPRDFGTSWAREGRSLALLTPSVIVPHDCNVIINPLHGRASELRVVGCERITIDERLRRNP